MARRKKNKLFSLMDKFNLNVLKYGGLILFVLSAVFLTLSLNIEEFNNGIVRNVSLIIFSLLGISSFVFSIVKNKNNKQTLRKNRINRYSKVFYRDWKERLSEYNLNGFPPDSVYDKIWNIRLKACEALGFQAYHLIDKSKVIREAAKEYMNSQNQILNLQKKDKEKDISNMV